MGCQPPRSHGKRRSVSHDGNQVSVLNYNVLNFPGGKSGEYEDIREMLYTKIYANGSLLLQNVKEDREGVYMCQASNGIGNPIGRMVQLKVNCK